MTSLTVLIPTHGRSTLLRRTLESLAKCELPDEYAETVVIENGPRAGSEAVVIEASSAHPHLRLRYMHVERANKSHALNEAITSSPAETLALFLDDDVCVASSTISAYAAAARTHGRGHYFGGPFSVRYEVQPEAFIVTSLPTSAVGCTYEQLARDTYVFGFNWAAFVGDIQFSGGFNPDYGPGSISGATGQETEMQKRLNECGCQRVVIRGAEVEHYVPFSRSTASWVVRRWFRHGVGSGQQIAERSKRNVIPQAVLLASRSLILLPIVFGLRDRRRTFGHQLRIARAMGLFYGFLRMRIRMRQDRAVW